MVLSMPRSTPSEPERSSSLPYVLRTVHSEATARETRIPLVVHALETLRHAAVIGLASVAADVRDFVQPQGVVHVAGDVHLFPSPERNVGQHGQQHFGIHKAHFVHQDEVRALSSAGL
ncbi:Hypothetical protein SMAX5B_007042 [Scophthalmus maximus]|uniref:Uncharacterized protein n=1 Tax=Scophthalmus maximus TaxID=52904 RepID=A0A2U9B3B6_SCOMX|nr:Hypothetical protein SMAX5B_007042 [Scophthalmus maximus]KAF0023419.1 hypothetical protein F2P81_024049 [Scophthalmus maximus]